MIRELWSSEDEANATLLREACASGSLEDALFAVEGSDAVVRAETLRWLGRWSERVAEIIGQRWYGNAQRALARVLVEEMSFRGDTCDYHSPRNSYLSSVVRRRRGMPILLSCIWCIVGRRAGLDVEGIGLPGHFVVRVDGLLVDPFAGGRPLTVDDCRAIVRRLSCGRLQWTDAWLEPVQTPQVIERVLRNLVASLLQDGDAVRIYRALRLMTTLDPERIEFRLQRARVAEELGALDEAETIFAELARQGHCRRTAQLAASRLSVLDARKPVVN